MRRNRGMSCRRGQRGFLLNPYRYGSGGGGGPIAEAVSIHTDLVSWWSFDENDAGSTYSDPKGGHNLSVLSGGSSATTSSVSTASGKVSRAFYINGTNDRTAYVPRSNTALDLPNSDWSFGGWFIAPGAGGVSRFFMGRWGSGATGSQAAMTVDSSDNQVHFVVSTDGSAVAARADSGANNSGTEWRLMVATLDRANNLIRIRIKGATADVNVTAAFAGALYTSASTSNFCVNDSLSGDSTFFSGTRGLAAGGACDECFYLSHAMTEDEFLYLYNSGNGKSYAQLLADAGI